MLGQVFGTLGHAVIFNKLYTEPALKKQGEKVKQKNNLEEEVEFWLSYINRWEATRNEPVPERVQLLLENAVLKLESKCFDKRKDLLLQSNNQTVH